jgi:hypothetical protein
VAYDGIHWDCDDTSAAVFNFVCLDADGDGWCAPGTGKCVGAEIDVGYRLAESGSRYDCDDTDPTLQQAIFGDEDGDGDRADSAHPSACIDASGAGPQGYYLTGSDCNDHDPRISSFSADVLFDGEDTNCDGDDGAQQCAEMASVSEYCPCWPRDTCQAAPTCADRPDLSIVDVEFTGLIVCSTDSATSSVLVVNTGGVTFDGSCEVLPVYGIGPRDGSFTLSLAPGESRIVRVYPSLDEVTLHIISGDDCRLDNNTARIPVVATSCDG